MRPALKIVISLWLVVISITIAPQVFAQEDKTICTKKGEPVEQKDLAKCWNADAQTTFSLQGIIGAGLGLTAGVNPFTKIPVRGVDPGTGVSKLTMQDRDPGGGAIMGLALLTSSLYNPPISSYEYLASLGENLGIQIKPAYAQVTGSGEGIIKPVLKLWQVTRNIAYLAFIVVFIVIGFMVMFRQKINPQTVISIQAALPGLVIGLILVTFSYFIAALLVDISFLGIKLVTEIFIQALPNALGDADKLKTLADNSNILQLFNTAQGVVWNNTGDVSDAIYKTAIKDINPFMLIIPAIIGTIAAMFLGPVGWLGAIGAAAGGVAVGLNISSIVSAIITLILVIALLIQMFRLFFSLLGTYIQILVATITGPLIILVSSIPGRNAGVNNWIKGLIANVLVFPAVFTAFLFAGLILASPSSDWRASPPLFGGLTTEVLKFLLAYGILLGVPSVPDAVRGAFGIKPQQGGFMQAAMAGFMGGFGVGRGATAAGWKKFTEPMNRVREARQKAEASYTAGVTDTQPPALGSPRTGGRTGYGGILGGFKNWYGNR